MTKRVKVPLRLGVQHHCHSYNDTCQTSYSLLSSTLLPTRCYCILKAYSFSVLVGRLNINSVNRQDFSSKSQHMKRVVHRKCITNTDIKLIC